MEKTGMEKNCHSLNSPFIHRSNGASDGGA